MRAYVPPKQLLVFDVKEGWAPLCKFLQLPVPDVPFPNINDANEIRLYHNNEHDMNSMTFFRYACLLVKLLSWGSMVLVCLFLVYATQLLLNSQTNSTDISSTGYLQEQICKIWSETKKSMVIKKISKGRKYLNTKHRYTQTLK